MVSAETGHITVDWPVEVEVVDDFTWLAAIFLWLAVFVKAVVVEFCELLYRNAGALRNRVYYERSVAGAATPVLLGTLAKVEIELFAMGTVCIHYNNLSIVLFLKLLVFLFIQLCAIIVVVKDQRSPLCAV